MARPISKKEKECKTSMLHVEDEYKELFTLRDLIIAAVPSGQALDLTVLRRDLRDVGADRTVEISQRELLHVVAQLQSDGLVSTIEDDRITRNF